MSSAPARVAIVASGVPADRAAGLTAPASRRSHGMNAGSDSHAERLIVRACRSSRRRRRRTSQRDGVALDEPERRAQRAPRGVAADVGPRRAGVVADAPPQRRRRRTPWRATSARPPVGRGDRRAATAPSGVGRRRRAGRPAPARSASTIAGNGCDVSHSGGSAPSGSAPRRSSVAPGRLDASRPARGGRRRSAAHAAASSVLHTSVGRVRSARARSSATVDVGRAVGVASSSSMRVAHERARRRSGRRRPAPRRSAWRSRQPGQLLHAPGAGPRARARGRRRRGRSGRCRWLPTLTSAARAHSSSRRAWVRRSWSAVIADSASAGRRWPAGARPTRPRRRGSRSARPPACGLQRVEPRAQAGRVEAPGRRRRSRRPAWRLPSPRRSPASRRSAMSCRRSRSGPGAGGPDGLGERRCERWAPCTKWRHGSLTRERVDRRPRSGARGMASSTEPA